MVREDQFHSLGWHQLSVGLAAGILDDLVNLRQATAHLLGELQVMVETDDSDLNVYFDLLRTDTMARILDKYVRFAIYHSIHIYCRILERSPFLVSDLL